MTAQSVVSAEYGDLESAARVIQAGRTAAVFVEPVQGEGGVFPAQTEFLQGLRQLCDDAGALLVFDEVQCGLGRTGKLWGHEHYGVSPDVMTLAKPLAGGLPIGAILMTEDVASSILPGDHGSTFAGGPLVTHAAIAVFDRVQSCRRSADPGRMAQARRLPTELQAQCRPRAHGTSSPPAHRALSADPGRMAQAFRLPTELQAQCRP
ncbi:hypothetical protein CYMTET_49736, partial [Cymbomonas tetramitiformis]